MVVEEELMTGIQNVTETTQVPCNCKIHQEARIAMAKSHEVRRALLAAGKRGDKPKTRELILELEELKKSRNRVC